MWEFLAMSGQPAQGDEMIVQIVNVLMIVAIFAFGYFIIWRPSIQQQQQAEELRSSLKNGDNVIFGGGLYGVIVKVDEDTVHVKVADNVKIKVMRAAIEARVTPANGS